MSIKTSSKIGKGLEALNQACLELHKGADGVSKNMERSTHQRTSRI